MNGHLVGKPWKNNKKTWYVVIELERKGEDKGGKREQKWYTPHKELGLPGPTTKAQAQSFLINKLHELKSLADNKPQPPQEKITLENWLTQWVAAKSDLRQSTIAMYKSIIQQHIVPDLGQKLLDEITALDVQQLLTHKRNSGRSDGRIGGLSIATVRHILAILNASLNHAVNLDVIDKNVASKALRPKMQEASKMLVWTPEQAQAFLASTKTHRLYALFALLLNTGMRRGEILGLRWENVDLKNLLIFVQEQYVPAVKGNIFQETKTDAGRRAIAIPPLIAHDLEQHRCRQNEELIVLGKTNSMGVVFTSEVGTPIGPRNLGRTLESLAKKAGVPVISPHGIRHSAATLMLKLGTHPKVVQERLGHANIAITLDIYSHVLPGLQAEAAEKLDSLLRSKPEENS
ncbi:MAG: site-specific integrase [Firmicutes bacterium]|nr:site-specific integrase [Bacillota bacterium]